MKDLLDLELEKIDGLTKPGLVWVEYIAYSMGINIAPRKRSSGPCAFLRIFVLVSSLSTIYCFFRYIKANFMFPFETYVESVLLSFQLLAGMLKLIHFSIFLESCVELVETSETGNVLKNLGLFDLDLTNKQALCNTLSSMLKKNWLMINRQVMLFFKAVVIPVLYYCVRPYFQYIYDCYIVKDNECEMTLTIPALVPFVQLGKYEVPSYWVRFYLLQIGPFWCGFTIFACNGLFVVLTNHEACLLEILRYLVRNSTSDSVVPKQSRDKFLRCCVKLFVRISRYHSEFESLFKYIILVQCVISSILICLLLYKLTTVFEIGSLGMIMLYLVAIALEISLYNVNAQKVESQSELLFYAWYNCDWYNESEDFKFIIKQMLAFSSRNFELSVGGFTNLSHSFLVQIFRLSGNFFLFLSNMRDK